MDRLMNDDLSSLKNISGISWLIIHLEQMKLLKSYVTEQKENMLAKYPEQNEGILILNYIERVFLNNLK